VRPGSAAAGVAAGEAVRDAEGEGVLNWEGEPVRLGVTVAAAVLDGVCVGVGEPCNDAAICQRSR
jgi:hypothetical protein